VGFTRTRPFISFFDHSHEGVRKFCTTTTGATLAPVHRAILTVDDLVVETFEAVTTLLVTTKTWRFALLLSYRYGSERKRGGKKYQESPFY